VPLLPTTVGELRRRIAATVAAVTPDMLARVWNEFDYRLDVCRASGGEQIEHLWGKKSILKLGILIRILKFTRRFYLHSFQSYR